MRAGAATGFVNIVVAEPLGLVREALAGLLAPWPYGTVREAATLADAKFLCGRASSILLVAQELLGPDPAAGLHAFRAGCPGARIVLMTPSESRDGVPACLVAGAHGFVARTARFADLVRAIDTLHGGGVHLPAAPEAAPALSSLTRRQRDVLRLLAEGRSTKDIARALDLAVSTIKVHLAAVYRVFGARNRVEALCRAGCLPASLLGPARTA